MRSKIVMTLAALTFVVAGCEKRETTTHTIGHDEPVSTTPGIGGGPSDKLGGHDDDQLNEGMSAKDGGLSGDPQNGAESLSGGGAKTSNGTTGESMSEPSKKNMNE